MRAAKIASPAHMQTAGARKHVLDSLALGCQAIDYHFKMAEMKRTRSRKKHPLRLHVQLPFEGSKVSLSGLSASDRVSDVKCRQEQDIGILQEMYHLSYLDTAPMEDESTLADNDVISGGTLQVRPWRMWADLLSAAWKGDIDECFGISMDLTGSTEWSRHCAWCALFIASHRGHFNLVAKLIEKTSIPMNAQSESGWTVLHAAARMGQWKALCILVDHGIDVRVLDANGQSAFDLARKHGHKKCEHSLNFCQWNLQKDKIVKERRYDYDAGRARQNASRQAHLYRDSTLTTWLSGPRGNLYMAQVPNTVSVHSVARHKREREERATLPEIKIAGEERPNSREKLDFDYGWFDSLRAQQLIPPTQHVLTYANPSSCHLRPRSLLNPRGFKTQLYFPPPAPPTTKRLLASYSARRKVGGAG